METFRGYKIKGRKGLSNWSSLLEEWLLAIERYCRLMDGEDAPYYYNERANISVLSGAAWRAGWVSLEEFQQEKGYSNQKKKNGRADLWLASEKDSELVEAKYKWICMESNEMARIINEIMESASDDVKKSRASSKNIKAIGIGFFPVYKNKKHVQDIDKLIESTINEFKKQNFHAMAWCFPKEMRGYVSKKSNNMLPGIIMLAKNIDY